MFLHLLENYLCEDGFRGFGGHCYRWNSHGRQYAHAVHYCRTQGGELVEITSREEQDYVEGEHNSCIKNCKGVAPRKILGLIF